MSGYYTSPATALKMVRYAALHGIMSLEKTATSKMRLLSTAGVDLRGATRRQLKFLRRRGLKPFTPKETTKLMAQGYLPSTEKVMQGAATGTTNMLQRPLGNGTGPMSSPARVLYKEGPEAVYSANPFTRKVTVPLTYRLPRKGMSVEEQLAAQGTARHEARELVRGSAYRAKGGNTSSPGLLDREVLTDVGSSHNPGVLYDERLFKTQTANRLGLDLRWEDMPLYGGDMSVVRSARDVSTGLRPLDYDFRLRKTSRKLLDLGNKSREAGVQMPTDIGGLARMAGVRPEDVSDVMAMRRLSPYVRTRPAAQTVAS